MKLTNIFCNVSNKSNSNILDLNTIGFKAQSLWGRTNQFNQIQVFEGRGKPEYPGKNPSEQRREKHSTHI